MSLFLLMLELLFFILYLICSAHMIWACKSLSTQVGATILCMLGAALLYRFTGVILTALLLLLPVAVLGALLLFAILD